MSSNRPAPTPLDQEFEALVFAHRVVVDQRDLDLLGLFIVEKRRIALQHGEQHVLDPSFERAPYRDAGLAEHMLRNMIHLVFQEFRVALPCDERLPLKSLLKCRERKGGFSTSHLVEAPIAGLDKRDACDFQARYTISNPTDAPLDAKAVFHGASTHDLEVTVDGSSIEVALDDGGSVRQRASLFPTRKRSALQLLSPC